MDWNKGTTPFVLNQTLAPIKLSAIMYRPIKLGYFSKQWLRDHNNDFYVRQSKRNNYRSRAAYKLMQMNEKYTILNGNILDLGSAPGSWSQIALELKCNVVAIDILPMKRISGVKFIQGDILDQNIIDSLIDVQFDNIISDMAPNFCGDHEMDHQNILQLNRMVMYIAKQCLKPNGNLIMKTLVGSEEKNNYENNRKYFQHFYREKPLSSKKESTELFYVGKHFIKSM